MVTIQRLLFVVQVALFLLLSSSMVLLTQAWFGILLLSKVYQLSTASQQTLWSIKRVNILALVGIGLFVAQLPQLGIVHLMIHLLYFAAVLRLLSLRWQRKDAEQLFIVHYILLACAVILQQQLWFAALVVCVALVNLAVQWLWSAQGDTMPRLGSSKLLGSSFVLMVLMFVVIPHLPPFWKVPSPKLAKSGIAEQLSPNEISQLLLSDALAFRVTFDDPTQLSASSLYFRARVYEKFDGDQWRGSEHLHSANFTAKSAGVGYQVIVEPHQQQWLFNLGVATSVSNGDIKPSQFGILYRKTPVTQRISYHVVSSSTIPRTERSVRPFLQLPTDSNSKTVQRGQQAIIKGLTPTQVVHQIRQFFLENGFVYTTSPGSYVGTDGVDNFMEQGRKGFCVHYAQASVVWLRAAGIPARLVAGYLGGQWQNGDEYLRVTQAEAHAWVEYLDDNEWKMFDPTLLIHPELAVSRDQTTTSSLFGNFSGDFWGPGHFGGFLVQLARDLDYYWVNKVVSFEQEDQSQIQTSVRQWLRDHWQTSIVVMVALGFIIQQLLWWRRWMKRPLAQRLLGPLYLLKQPQETVNQLLQRLMVEYPEQQKALSELRQGYLTYVYQGQSQHFVRLNRQAHWIAKRVRAN
ncbi:MAG TPA: hypothetical protein DCS87_08645 [Rheinheimera sp.]|nr:hypothetical protein [Rheinheimera sp.]